MSEDTFGLDLDDEAFTRRALHHILHILATIAARIDDLEPPDMSAINDAAAALQQAANDLADRIASLPDAAAAQAALDQANADMQSAVDVVNQVAAQLAGLAVAPTP